MRQQGLHRSGVPVRNGRAAQRSGAGILGVPESIYAIEAVKLNEPVVFPLPDEGGKMSEKAVPEVLERLGKMDAVLMGCGMGMSAGTLAVLETVLKNAKCPVVLDADGINLVSAHKDLLRGRTAPTVLTPHDGEYLRLAGSLGKDRMTAAGDLARELGCVVVLKGHRTWITDGASFCRNTTGNPGMAVGGSGDMLAGMIVSLLGQGMGPLEAAECAVWLHGAAGDLCQKELGQYGMLPSDMLEALPRLMK